MLYHSVNYYNLYTFTFSGVGASSVRNTLNETKEKLFNLANELLETSQSEGFIEVNIPPTRVIIDSLEFTEILLKFIRGNKGVFQSYQSFIIDQIEVLLSKTIYRIKYLK